MEIVDVQKVPVFPEMTATNNVIILVIYLHNTKTILSIVFRQALGMHVRRVKF